MDRAILRFAIGVLSERTGVNIETIRYYEKVGVLEPAPRTEGGYRLYSFDDMRRLAFIRRARELGFSLDEVRALLDLVDERGRSCAEARDVALHHLADVRAKVADLKVMERVLKEMVAQCADGTLPDCPLLEALFRGPPEARILARGRESRRAGSQAFSTAPSQPPVSRRLKDRRKRGPSR